MWGRGDALDEVVRHAGLKAWAAHEHPDLRCPVCKIDRRLTGRIAGTDQRDLPAGAELCLQGRRPVMYGGAFERGEVIDIEPAVARAAGDDDGVGSHAFLIGELQPEAAGSRVRVLF